MTTTNQPTTLDFMGLPLTVITHNNQMWLTAKQVGECLGYAAGNASTGITNLYNRHIEEFEASDTCNINLMLQGGVHPQNDGEPSKGGNPNVRVFSATGCHILGFFANTARAAEFRRWAKQALTTKAPPAAEPPHVAPYPARVGYNIITRQIEFDVLTLFVQGWRQADIARHCRISKAVVCTLVHGQHRFTDGAGEDLTTTELIEAVVARHMGEERARITRKYITSAANQKLTGHLDGQGRMLLLGQAA